MMDATTKELYMQRCLDLAYNGLGSTAPNPMVGSVIVHEGKIIGEGYHQKYGGPHAEVNAVNAVAHKNLLAQSTMFVSLEPCCHHGKTPPCTDLIIKHKIPKVIIATEDPFAQVSGLGIKKLTSAGINVETGILKDMAHYQNRRFLTFHTQKRPYIILKWAQTADGFIDIDRQPGSAAQPTWITSEKLRMLVHKWRTEEQGIMVGTVTALKDNPALNVRDWSGPNPLRIVLDQNLTLSKELKLFDNTQNTLVFNQIKNEQQNRVEHIKTDFGSPDLLENILTELYERNIQSLIIEGGSRLLNTFIEKDLWDEARMFQGSKFFSKGLRAPDLPVQNFVQTNIGQEVLFTIFNPLNSFTRNTVK